PVLAALQFFGGVEPLAVLVGYAALAATVLSLGGLGVLCSVYARDTRTAGQRVARVVVLYVILVVVLGQALRAWPGVAAFPGGPVTVQDAADLFAAGSPFAAGNRAVAGVRGGGSFGDAVWPPVRDYILFHL